MLCSFLSLNMSLLQQRVPQFLLMVTIIMIGVESAVNRVNDPKFLAGTSMKLYVGYKNLFVQNLSSFPDTMVYQITFPQAMPSPSTYYDLVVSINTFSLVESNTIGWNFTKMNLNINGFQLKYDAGVNSVIYSLAVNYMIVDNSYPDFQIAYFSMIFIIKQGVQCQIMSIGSNFRSQNVTYTIKKFGNDSNYAKMTVLESFNMTNTMVDDLILKNNIYQNNLTLTIQYYTWGLQVINDFQFTLILYNTAYMLATNDRTVMVNTWALTPTTSAPTIQATMINDFTKVDRFFSGVSGFNLTRTGNKTFQFRLYVGNVFTFQFSSTFIVTSTGITNVDYAAISVYVMVCPIGVWSWTANDCVTTCPGTEFVDSTNKLSFCTKCHYSCNGCWDDKNTSCKLCSSTTRNPVRTTTVSGSNWYSCFCNIGYFEVYQQDCVQCSTTLPGCINCANNATCLQCQSGMYVFNNVCVCNLANQTLFNGACVDRIRGCQTHVYNGSRLLCVQCYVQRNFTITSGFYCACQKPTYQIIEDITGAGDYWCNYICGDGNVADAEECDDNNILSGDGCSDKCKIQRNFTCSNLPNQASVCLYNLTTQLTFRWAERRIYENSAVLNFTLEPYCTFWNQVTNWSALVNTNMPVTKIEDDFFCSNLWDSLRCNLTLTVQYNAHLQNQPFNISLNLANNPKIRFNSRQLQFVPTGNVVELTYQPQSHLDSMSTIGQLMLALTIIALAIMLMSIYFDKMIGLQMIMTIQFMYYLLSGVENNTIQFIPMDRYLKYSTGYNTIFNYTYHSYAPLPNHLNHIYYEKQFLLNMNVMLLILAIAVFIFIVAKLIKILKQYLRKQRQDNNTNASRVFDSDSKDNKYFDAFYKFYWNNVFFVLVMFLMYQVLFDCIVTVILNDPTWTIFSSSLNFVSEIFSFFVIVLVILAVAYWYYQNSRKKGRMSLDNSQFIPLEFKLCQKQYILMYTIVQAVKIWIVALFFDQSYCYFIILPVCVIYFVALVIFRPYRRRDDVIQSLDGEDPQAQDKLCFSIHNFGICFNEFCLIIFITLCLIWNVNNYTLDSDFPQVILYTSISIIILLIIVAILRMLYKKLGLIFMCDYFKDSRSAVSFDNDSEKVRRLVRNENTKVVEDDVYSGKDDGDNAPPTTRRQRSKILQDVKKAKQFLIDWKDDAKAVYYNNQYPDSDEDEVDSYDDRNDRDRRNYQHHNSQPRLDRTAIYPSNLNNSFQDGLIFTNNDKTNYRNPGMVQMQSIPKNLNQSNYQYNKSNEKKIALLNKSILQSLLDKKQEEIMTNRKISTSMLNGSAIVDDRKRGEQDLFHVKERLRRELQMKNGMYKNQLHDYVLKD